MSHWLERYRDPVRALALRKAHRQRYYAENRDEINKEARAWAMANPDKRKLIMRRHDVKRKDRIRHRNRQTKMAAVEYKGGKCVDCNTAFHPAAMDFHHTVARKGAPAPSQYLSWNWERAKEELDKCVLLCSNCHRIRHYLGSYQSRTPPSI